MYDNSYPNDLIETYMQYYKMSNAEFDSLLDRHVNKKLFQKENGIWQPIFTVGENFEIEENECIA